MKFLKPKNICRLVIGSAAVLAAPLISHAGGSGQCDTEWLTVSDAEFAEICESKAFSDSLADQQEFAWKAFARMNQLDNGAPKWDYWPSDKDTFTHPNDVCANPGSRADRTIPLNSAKVQGVDQSLADEVTENPFDR
ncbi:MAG: hypothetical protein GKR95_23860 [Gammaproteobacteria bacterium]|nr:hypothetical protein [Gammaproteobacteria bacterium]